MPQGNISVNTGSLYNAATTIDGLREQLQGVMNQMDSTVSQLASTWDSPAHERLNGHFREVYAQYFPGYVETLEEYSTFLRNTAAKYQATEHELSNTANAQAFST